MTTHNAGSMTTVELPISWVVPNTNQTPEELRTGNLFRVFVGHANELVIVPCTDLACSLLAIWMSCEVSMSRLINGAPPGADGAWGRGTRELRMTFKSPPLIASGNDPFYTGASYPREDVQAAKEFASERCTKRYEAERAAKQPKQIAKRKR